MSSTTLDQYTDSNVDETIHYRALHTGAISAFVLGVCLHADLSARPLALKCLDPGRADSDPGHVRSLRSLRKNSPRERSVHRQMPLAVAGLALSTFFLVTGVGYGYYVYRNRGARRLRADLLRIASTHRAQRTRRHRPCRRRSGARPASGSSSRATSGPARRPCELVSIDSSWSATITSAASAICRRSTTSTRWRSRSPATTAWKTRSKSCGWAASSRSTKRTWARSGLPVFSLKADYAVQ